MCFTGTGHLMVNDTPEWVAVADTVYVGDDSLKW